MSRRRTHLDASIIIGWLDGNDAHHSAATKAIAAARQNGYTFGISAAAYAEVLVRPLALGGEATDLTKRALASLTVDEPTVIDAAIAERSAELRAKHQWLTALDAMIVASSESAATEHLLTTDKRLARLPGVKLVD